jgi:hypothetical protein
MELNIDLKYFYINWIQYKNEQHILNSYHHYICIVIKF